MRILRNVLLILFIITSIVFSVFQYRSYKDRDRIAPEILCNQDTIHLSVKDNETKLLEGVSAIDDRDGDVTDTLVVAGKSNFIEEGIIRVDYAAFDSHNNVGTYSRRAVFDDYISPRFSSKEPLVLHTENSYDFSFFHAEDVLSGDISNKIKILSDKYTTTSSSEYPIEIEVTNNFGDIEKLEIVMKIETNSEYNRRHPALSDYIVYVPLGKELDLKSYIIGIRQGDKVFEFEDTDYSKEDIDIEDYIDYNNEGVYNVMFSLHLSNFITTETRMVVVVTEDF